MIFTQNHSTLQRTTGARFCRTELLRTPFERILSILSNFKPTSTPEVSAHIRYTICISKKFNINFFSPISAYSQTTKEILHKNVFYHSDIIFFENSRKSWVSGKKGTSESDAHSAVWWRSQLDEVGTGFGKKKGIL